MGGELLWCPAQVWNGNTKSRVEPADAGKRHSAGFNIEPNSEWVLTASQDGVAQVWDAITGVEAGRPIKEMESAVQSLPVRATFTSDGKWILTAWRTRIK